MAAPKLVNRRLLVGNASESGGRWILDHLMIASVQVAAVSSGLDDDPYVKFIVDWGDGSVDTGDFLPVGRDFAYQHTYDTPGEFFIRIRCVNSSGTFSAASPNDVAALRIMPQAERQIVLRRWGGLGLPILKLSTPSASTQTLYPSTTTTLASRLASGSFDVILAGGISLEPGTEVTIWQPGRKVTFGRVVKDQGAGKFTLTIPAQDDYDVATANVEMRRRSYAQVSSLEGATDSSWAFPTIYDTDLVQSSITMLLETRIGERLMRPWIGSRLPELVFEQATPLLDQIAAAYTSDAVAPEPRVSISSVTVVTTGPNGRKVKVKSSLANAPEQVFEAEISLSNSPDT